MGKERQEGGTTTTVPNVPETETKEQATTTVNNDAPQPAGNTISMTPEVLGKFMQDMMKMFTEGMSAQNAKSKREELNRIANENSAFREGIRRRAVRMDVFTVRWKRIGGLILLKPYLDGKEDYSKDFYFTFARKEDKYNLYIHVRNKGQYNNEYETEVGTAKIALLGNPEYVAEAVASTPLFQGDPVNLAQISFYWFNSAYGRSHHMCVDTANGYTEL